MSPTTQRQRTEVAAPWSCDEKNGKSCRNPHGCHCREIRIILDREAECRMALAYLEKDKRLDPAFLPIVRAGLGRGRT